MSASLTESKPVVQTRAMGRKPLIGKRETRITFSSEDIAYLEAVAAHHGLSSITAAIRYCVRDVARREKIPVTVPQEES